MTEILTRGVSGPHMWHHNDNDNDKMITRKKASKKTDCRLFAVIDSADNSICMGDSWGTFSFHMHHHQEPLCPKPGREMTKGGRGAF